MSSNPPSRRRVLQGAGIALVSALAGCGAAESTTTTAWRPRRSGGRNRDGRDASRDGRRTVHGSLPGGDRVGHLRTINGVDRSIAAPNGYSVPDAIRTGVPVNPGTSGGPLLTLNGEVVGVIDAGGGEDLAFAISAALAKRAVPALVEEGEYTRVPRVALRTVTPRVAERAGLDDPRGVLVRQVLANGPLGRRAPSLAGGDDPTAVLREGERRTVEVTLGERRSEPA